ncbi:hypothetical protein AG1IA_09436 [Rhizoctonia solani AG-1 IA]|uniref:Uncharacterized protein n=1 Tax=Thanatephorus cucumeris (strain AG1-IA) TaxID=983506 RepID=L8WIG1_THACA|nr:hypothetical protein AG1IA_09436 [Rhizoctonia solani AG-1 IA]
MSHIPRGPCAIAFPRDQLLTLDDNKIGPVVLEALDNGAQEVGTLTAFSKLQKQTSGYDFAVDWSQIAIREEVIPWGITPYDFPASVLVGRAARGERFLYSREHGYDTRPTNVQLRAGRFATKPAESQNSDLAGACSESRDDRFTSCQLASDLLHRPASYTPSVAARLCVSFYPTHHPIGHESWFGPPTHEPDSRSGAPGPPSLLRSRGGSPTSPVWVSWPMRTSGQRINTGLNLPLGPQVKHRKEVTAPTFIVRDKGNVYCQAFPL